MEGELYLIRLIRFIDYYWSSYYPFVFLRDYFALFVNLFRYDHGDSPYITSLPSRFVLFCFFFLCWSSSFFFLSLFLFLTLTMVCCGMVSSIVHMVLFGCVCKSGFIYLVWCCKINCLCYKSILFEFITHFTPVALVYLAVVLEWLLLLELQLEVYCLHWKRWHHGQLMWCVLFYFIFTSVVVVVVVRAAMGWCKSGRCRHFGSGGP